MRLLRLCLMSICLWPAGALAIGDPGIAVIEALAQCDGRFFRALQQDAPRWRSESAYVPRGNIASFMVANRTPPAPYFIEATEARFSVPIDVKGLRIVSFFDGDLSQWDHFANNNIQFVSWGFYVKQSPKDLMLWLARNVPNTALQLAAPRPGSRPGSFCIVHGHVGGAWRPSEEPCDAALPTESSPRRVFGVREAPYEHAGAVLSCDLWGTLTPEILNPLRPDLLRK